MQKVNIEAFKIIGIAVKTTNQEGKAAKQIPELWKKFMEEAIIDQISNKIDDRIYSLYTDYEGDHNHPYTAIIGCKVTNLDVIPSGMIGKSFEAGEYVKITAKGDLTQNLVINEWLKIWQSDLNRAYSVDFEIYDERSKNIKEAEVDIFVAIN